MSGRLSARRAVASGLLSAQVQYRLHDTAASHVLQRRVGVFQVVAGNESGKIKSSGELRQGPDVSEIVLLGEASRPDDTQFFARD